MAAVRLHSAVLLVHEVHFDQKADRFLCEQTEFGDGTLEEPINHEYPGRDLVSR